jgi:hypothetical protein
MVASRDEETGMTTLRTIGCSIFLALTMAAAAFAVPGFAAPVVVIYPLTLSGAVVHSEVGSDVAILIGTRLAQDGSITVRPYTPGTTRAQFLDAALKENADYYVTGYLQQLGPDVSMILQVVSTHSGSVVFSSTTTIKTFGDAAAQADPLRAAILRHAGRGLAGLDAPAAASIATAEPTANQGVNLTRALRRHVKAAPSPSPAASSDAELVPVSQIQAGVANAAPRPAVALLTPAPLHTPSPSPSPAQYVSPSPTPSPTPFISPTPSPTPIATTPFAGNTHKGSIPAGAVTTILVVDTAGTENADARARASSSLVEALRDLGFPAARLAIESSQATTNAHTICHANPGIERFYEPTLAIRHNAFGQSLATISVTSIDCNGTFAAKREATSVGTASGGDLSAIDRAATVVAGLLNGV